MKYIRHYSQLLWITAIDRQMRHMGGFKLRRKQLYAIILAGALATGGAPITAMAADAAAEAGASEETGDLGSGDTLHN